MGKATHAQASCHLYNTHATLFLTTTPWEGEELCHCSVISLNPETQVTFPQLLSIRLYPTKRQ